MVRRQEDWRNDDNSIALVISADGTDIFDVDQLGERARRLVEGTDFDSEALVALALWCPGGSEHTVYDVTTTGDGALAVWLYYENTAGPNGEFIRKMVLQARTGGETVASAVGVLSNPPHADSDPYRFSTEDEQPTHTG